MSAAHHFDGPVGRLVARAMARGNADAEREAVETLAPGADDTVVAIGVGPGVGVELLAHRVRRVVAVDPSRVMVDETVRRNRRAVDQGIVEVFATRADALPVPDRSIDGAIAVNSIQLWDPLGASLVEVTRALRPSARLVTFTHDWAIQRSTGRTPDDWAAWVEELAAPLGLVGLERWRGRAEGGRSIALVLTRAGRP